VNMPPRIPVTEAQIDRVVSKFYARIRAHPALGPVFAAHAADWTAHEEKIGRFWRNALLLHRCYDGNPMQVHMAAGNVKALHFPVWLSLFDTVLDQELPRPLTQAWSARRNAADLEGQRRDDLDQARDNGGGLPRPG